MKELRIALGKTQKEFAESLGTVQGFISDIENGRKQPSRSLIVNAIEKHSIDATWLLTGEGKMFREKEQHQNEEDDDFPDDPEQGMAMLDSLLDMLIKKGLIDESDIPPPLAGVKRERIKMREDTKRVLMRELEEHQKETARIKAELAKFSPDEAHENEVRYGAEEKSILMPLIGRIAAGVPLDTSIWPEEWLRVSIKGNEGPNTHFLLEVKGTSMAEGGIPDGALILVRRAERAETGEVAVVYFPGEGVTLKRILHDRENRTILQWRDGSGRSRELAQEDLIQGIFIRLIGGK